jgi:transcriptional regulator with GAF, ATPase, and Fis domain
MISHEKILGAITLLSEQTDAFDEDDLVVFQVIANSIGSVYERRLLVEEINHYLEEMKRLDRRYRSQIWADNPPGLDGMSYAYQGNVDHSDGDESRLPIEKKIVLRDQILGKITLEADRRDWDVQDEAFIEAVAAQTALALENVRLLEATQITAHHNRIVADLSNKIGASADLDNILKTTLEELVNELQASNGLIHLEIPPLFSPDERGSPQSS